MLRGLGNFLHCRKKLLDERVSHSDSIRILKELEPNKVQGGCNILAAKGYVDGSDFRGYRRKLPLQDVIRALERVRIPDGYSLRGRHEVYRGDTQDKHYMEVRYYRMLRSGNERLLLPSDILPRVYIDFIIEKSLIQVPSPKQPIASR